MPTPTTPVDDRVRELEAQRAPLAAVTKAVETRTKAEADVNAKILAALAAHCSVGDVAAAAGVHRSRVWQIRRDAETVHPAGAGE